MAGPQPLDRPPGPAVCLCQRRRRPGSHVLIVPGSRVYGDKPLPILRARLEAALDLYRAGRVKAILVSGQETAEAPESTVMRAWLRARGVPAATSGPTRRHPHA